MTKILTLIGTFFVFSILLAQDEADFSLKDSSNLKKKNFMKQYEYENNISSFPPKKKSNWAIGIDLGAPTIYGDIASNYMNSGGVGLKIRKGITHYLSIRYQGLYIQASGQDLKLRPVNGSQVYANYRARMTDNSLQAVFSVGNLNPHKRQSKVIFNFFAGAGLTTSFTQADYVNENGNAYDYSGIANMETWGDRFFVSRQLRELHDGNYETVTTASSNDVMMIRDTRLLPSVTVGTGMDIYLSKRVDLAFEYRLTANFDDNLDGLKSGSGKDIYSYASFGFNFKIGKREEPTYWQNPLANDFDNMAALRNQVTEEQINSIIDEKLAKIDTDKDGVIDAQDVEINSPKGAKVDAMGRAIDTDKDGVPDVNDKEINTARGLQVDAMGRAIKQPEVKTEVVADTKKEWQVFYAVNASKVSNAYLPAVLEAAAYLLNNPEKTVSLNGYADQTSSAEYNLKLSEKRAKNVMKVLVDAGVSPDRIITNYFGETDLFSTQGSNGNANQMINRRVTIVVE